MFLGGTQSRFSVSGLFIGYTHSSVQKRKMKVNQNNAYTLESTEGKSITLVGCIEDDCDCTSVIFTKIGAQKTQGDGNYTAKAGAGVSSRWDRLDP